MRHLLREDVELCLRVTSYSRPKSLHYFSDGRACGKSTTSVVFSIVSLELSINRRIKDQHFDIMFQDFFGLRELLNDLDVNTARIKKTIRLIRDCFFFSRNLNPPLTWNRMCVKISYACTQCNSCSFLNEATHAVRAMFFLFEKKRIESVWAVKCPSN